LVGFFSVSILTKILQFYPSFFFCPHTDRHLAVLSKRTFDTFDTLIENVVNHSKIVATEIIDDILKGAVKTDNNSTKRKHSVTDKTFVTWKEKFPWLCKVQM
jgi:hypothetical protein